jgi:tyrosyl-tRNA synthetase
MGLKGPAKSERQFDEDVRLNLQIASKMSKSNPNTCIFVHDSPQEIKMKLRNAYCPPKTVENNPVLETARLAVFTNSRTLTIARPPKYGGAETFTNFAKLQKAYTNGRIHPLDLKNAVSESLTRILEPVRRHFQKSPEKLEKMRGIEITR